MFRLLAMLAVCISLPARAAADDKPASTTEYYLGESKMTTTEGVLKRTSLALVKRVLKPAENKIEEYVLSINEDTPAKLYIVDMEINVKEKKFTMTERSKAFTGDGTLTGDDWKWKVWKSTSKMEGFPGTVVSEDTITDKGVTAKKTLNGADGKPMFLFDESLVPISAKTYEILSAKLNPAPKK